MYITNSTFKKSTQIYIGIEISPISANLHTVPGYVLSISKGEINIPRIEFSGAISVSLDILDVVDELAN